jgi:hypothetical protein
MVERALTRRRHAAVLGPQRPRPGAGDVLGDDDVVPPHALDGGRLELLGGAPGEPAVQLLQVGGTGAGVRLPARNAPVSRCRRSSADRVGGVPPAIATRSRVVACDAPLAREAAQADSGSPR